MKTLPLAFGVVVTLILTACGSQPEDERMIYEIRGLDGKIYQIEAPKGTSKAALKAELLRQAPQAGIPSNTESYRLSAGPPQDAMAPIQMAPDGTYVSGAAQMAPDGTYVSGTPQMAPDGTYVSGTPQMAPDGTYVSGTPQMAPDGTYVGGTPRMAPDGTYVGGTPRMAPDGTYVGSGN